MGTKYPTCGLPWAQDLFVPVRGLNPSPRVTKIHSLTPTLSVVLATQIVISSPLPGDTLSFSLEFSRKGFSEARVRIQFLSWICLLPHPPQTHLGSLSLRNPWGIQGQGSRRQLVTWIMAQYMRLGCGHRCGVQWMYSLASLGMCKCPQACLSHLFLHPHVPGLVAKL